ncbi:MAG: hypothetical protein U1E29_01230, partial [Coriobacteriia bacterium]|nr:hypothetical protein [Coriobacteriia bacterium]
MSGHKGGTQALALAILLAVASGVVVSLGHGVLLLVTLASIIIAWRTSDTYIAEWVLAGYLLAGTFKVAFNLPVDLTLALAVALVAVSLVRVIRSGFPNDFTPVLLVFPVVAVFLILGAFVPQASEYGLVKGLRFASLGILAVSSAWLLIRDDRSGNALMRALTILAGIICVGALFYGGVGSPTGRIT